MRSFFAFLKKELCESARSGKLVLLGLLFCLFGIMNPAIAKMTPWLMETLSGEMAEIGMTVAAVEVNAMTSWTQFFKNIPMALIAFVLVYSGIFTKEYESGTLILLLTKGLSRHTVVLAKSLLLILLWSVGYWTCFGITYAYNAYFWDNGIAEGLFLAVTNWWLFGVFVQALTVLFSTLAKTYSGVLLGIGGTVLVSYLVGLLPKLTPYLPTSLMGSVPVLIGAQTVGDCAWAIAITASASIACVAVGVPIFNRKQL
jgi:ABC-2 type transport system permease protein